MKNCPLSFSTTLIIFGLRREEGEATLDARVVRDLKLNFVYCIQIEWRQAGW